MKNAKLFRKLYEENAEECFTKWGYYYPPKTWDEFYAGNADVFEKHLTKDKTDIVKTKTYVSLLDTTNDFGFYIAFQQPDYELLNNVLYQVSRQKLLRSAMTASGSDHCNALLDAASSFACNDFDVIPYFFPQYLPHSKGTFFTEVSVNLLRVLYYKEEALKEDALKKATKFLEKKVTLWEKTIVTYFMALVHRNAQDASMWLQEQCVAYQKIGYPKSKISKCFAAEIHGMYRFVRLVDEELFHAIIRPKHDCFFEPFEVWQQEQNYPKGKLFYTYPSEMDYMNKIFAAQLPVVALKEADNSNGNKFYKDVERFVADLTENVKRIV